MKYSIFKYNITQLAIIYYHIFYAEKLSAGRKGILTFTENIWKVDQATPASGGVRPVNKVMENLFVRQLGDGKWSHVGWKT